MTIVDVELSKESQRRYLTYALSVVHSRALPDVRDGLKPVQRRILYAMFQQLHLYPDKPHRKSAAVVGEVLARFHPHGDAACYDALVRMAQDFNFRYPLIDGQGNFGSLDGDSAAAYRYTEARLTPFALEVLGEITEETVSERDNFDQTIKEPVVLPSRVPNLLANGSSGIAVGMATAIPPHNLKELIKGLQLFLDDPGVTEKKLLSAIKGPDFPTGCQIVNSQEELLSIYKTGRGVIRMRAVHTLETGRRGKQMIIITAIPYTVDKSVLVEKIADLIINKKVPQLVDVRDESTDKVRIVLELATPKNGEDISEKALAYLFKHTSLQSSFHVNLTALVPTENPYVGKPELLSLKRLLHYFIEFRLSVVRASLSFEKRNLEERVHVLQGLMAVLDSIQEVIKIVRKSEGRADASQKLQKRFQLTEKQALFIVDLRIYQLSRTSTEEVAGELKEKEKRIREIQALLKSEIALKKLISDDLARIDEEFGGGRLCPITSEVEEQEFSEEEYVEHEDVYVVLSKDGWMKRIRQTNDPNNTRLREGDNFLFVGKASTRDILWVFSNQGNVFGVKVFDVSSTSGFGEPVQKLFRFQDGEQVVGAHVGQRQEDGAVKRDEMYVFTKKGLGFRFSSEVLPEARKVGKKLVKIKGDDLVLGVGAVEKAFFAVLSKDGYGLIFPVDEMPLLSGAGKGVILQKLPRGDELVVMANVLRGDCLKIIVAQGKVRDLVIAELPESSRAKRGLKVVKRGLPVSGLEVEHGKESI